MLNDRSSVERRGELGRGAYPFVFLFRTIPNPVSVRSDASPALQQIKIDSMALSEASSTEKGGNGESAVMAARCKFVEVEKLSERRNALLPPNQPLLELLRAARTRFRTFTQTNGAVFHTFRQRRAHM